MNPTTTAGFTQSFDVQDFEHLPAQLLKQVVSNHCPSARFSLFVVTVRPNPDTSDSLSDVVANGCSSLMRNVDRRP